MMTDDVRRIDTALLFHEKISQQSNFCLVSIIFYMYGPQVCILPIPIGKSKWPSYFVVAFWLSGSFRVRSWG